MSAYLLDTNVWIALLKNDVQVVERVRRVGVSALHLCTPVWSELWFGACNSQRVAENQARLRDELLTNRADSTREASRCCLTTGHDVMACRLSPEPQGSCRLRRGPGVARNANQRRALARRRTTDTSASTSSQVL